MKSLILLDDSPPVLAEMKKALKNDFSCSVVRDPKRGIRRVLSEEPDGVITTLVMKEINGIDVIRTLRSSGYNDPILMSTFYGNASTAVEATRCGATDYITRPYPDKELIARAERMFAQSNFKNNKSIDRIKDGIRTNDPAMVSLLELAYLAAETESRVLLLGETGTGKELFAKVIHRRSKRADKPFVVLNCAAIQETLLESELFGHKRGSFTGATEDRVGRFEEARGGTLFLDEIGEISLSIQAKILRVLQNGEFCRVGDNRVQYSDARVVAATNQSLVAEVKAGRFRADLFYRLNVVSLTIPPLRERKNDIDLLSDYFLRRYIQNT